MGDFDGAATLLEGLLNTPQQFVGSNVVVVAQCSKAARLFFACGKQSPIPGGPLTELHVDGIDSEQIWQQIELENQPVLLHIEAQLKTLESFTESGNDHPGEEEDEEGEEGDEIPDEGDELLDLEGDEGDLADEGDEGDLEEDAADNPPISHKRGLETIDERAAAAAKKRKNDRDPALGGNILKFDDESSGEDEDEDEGDYEKHADFGQDVEPLGDEDENPFFDMEAMNKFADGGMSEQEDEGDGEGEGDEEQEEAANVKKMKYNDFFDAPPSKKASANEDDTLLSTFQ